MYQAQQDAKKNKFLGLQTGLGTKSVENFYKGGKSGAVSNLIGGLSPALGEILGSQFAGGTNPSQNQTASPNYANMAANAAKLAIAG